MDEIRVETTIETDGELHLSHLPCRKGDRVKATIVLLADGSTATSPSRLAEDERKREEALQRFFALADASRFCSAGRYPTRDELHERH